jgi:hypothetical protein
MRRLVLGEVAAEGLSRLWTQKSLSMDHSLMAGANSHMEQSSLLDPDEEKDSSLGMYHDRLRHLHQSSSKRACCKQHSNPVC